jgi:multisubunit Na+/H+ antiporter MnhE subunit
MATVLAVATFMILMGFWFAGAPAWTYGDLNLTALVAAAVVFILVKVIRRK